MVLSMEGSAGISWVVGVWKWGPSPDLPLPHTEVGGRHVALGRELSPLMALWLPPGEQATHHEEGGDRSKKLYK